MNNNEEHMAVFRKHKQYINDILANTLSYEDTFIYFAISTDESGKVVTIIPLVIYQCSFRQAYNQTPMQSNHRNHCISLTGYVSSKLEELFAKFTQSEIQKQYKCSLTIYRLNKPITLAAFTKNYNQKIDTFTEYIIVLSVNNIIGFNVSGDKLLFITFFITCGYVEWQVSPTQDANMISYNIGTEYPS